MPLTEEQWQSQVIDLARLNGFRCAHFRPARKADGSWATPVAADGKGFPDLELARPGDLIFAELKTERGRVSPDQVAWLEQLRLAGAEAYIWKPSDFEEVSRRLSRRGCLVS